MEAELEAAASAVRRCRDAEVEVDVLVIQAQNVVTIIVMEIVLQKTMKI